MYPEDIFGKFKGSFARVVTVIGCFRASEVGFDSKLQNSRSVGYFKIYLPSSF